MAVNSCGTSDGDVNKRSFATFQDVSSMEALYAWDVSQQVLVPQRSGLKKSVNIG